MNIKKNKIALALGSLILLAAPLSNASAHDKHCQIEETQLGDTMKYMKSELRAYVKGFKNDDPQKMQQHLNELLKLSSTAGEQTPVKITKMHDHDMEMTEMDHSQMDTQAMAKMDHSQMGTQAMAKMDHSQMDTQAMAKMDHSQMDTQAMAEMDHSQMDMKKMPEAGHVDTNIASHQHDMSSMPEMEGMSSEQHHQHMLYMEGIKQLNVLFKQLDNTQDTEQIKVVLADIKEHSKKSHQLFRQDCN